MKIKRMRLIVFASTLLFLQHSFSQIGTGQWRLHVSPTETVDVAAGNGVVLAAFPAGIVEYDVAENESSLWTDVNFLSDVNLSSLYFDPVSDAFWVGYDNGNIDKIKKNAVTNIPALKLASIQGDKKVNKFYAHNGFIYVSMGLGIMKINPAKNEVVDTYYPNASTSPILEIVIQNDTIYALTSKNILKGYLNNVALADPAQWHADNRVPDLGANAAYKSLVLFNNELCLSYHNVDFGKDSVYRVTSSGLAMVIGDEFDMEIGRLQTLNGSLYVVLDGGGGVHIYDNTFFRTNLFNTYSSNGPFRSNAVTLYNGVHYIGDENAGLVYYNHQADNHPVAISGPPKNSFFALGGNKNKIAVAGGTLKQTGFGYNLSGGYILEDEKWTLFNAFNQPAWEGQNLFDINSISINPKDANEMAFGAYSGVPVSVTLDGKQISSVFTPDNSILETSSLNNGSTCVTDVEYDENGNLWILNGQSNKPLKVKTKDGLWYEYDLGSTAKSKMSGRMVIDYNGNKWFYMRNAGLYGFKDNGTIADLSDDKYKLLNGGDYTGDLPSDNVTALAVDFDNEIWIGTDEGFAILYNSNNIFDAQAGGYNAQRIKLEYETNVEYMLGSTSITDIEVDGGNRKWIGTANAGIFLLSPDGMEILQSFTKENSALISNNIMDMQLNHQTGELFIVTDKGLLSYRTDATYSDPEYSNVTVFPNPVKPEFTGPVTMQGIKYNSDVKVTDIAGNLVYQTVSQGGTATWNCQNLKGERVKTGVYLIWTASNDEKGRKVGKVTVIN